MPAAPRRLEHDPPEAPRADSPPFSPLALLREGATSLLGVIRPVVEALGLPRLDILEDRGGPRPGGVVEEGPRDRLGRRVLHISPGDDSDAGPRYSATVGNDGRIIELRDLHRTGRNLIAKVGRGHCRSISVDETTGDVTIEYGQGRSQRTEVRHANGSRDVTTRGRTTSYNSENLVTRRGCTVGGRRVEATFDYGEADGPGHERVNVPALPPDQARRLGLHIQRGMSQMTVPEHITFGNGAQLTRNLDSVDGSNFAITDQNGNPIPGLEHCKSAAVDAHGNTHVIVEQPQFHPTTGAPLGFTHSVRYIIGPEGLPRRVGNSPIFHPATHPVPPRPGDSETPGDSPTPREPRPPRRPSAPPSPAPGGPPRA